MQTELASFEAQVAIRAFRHASVHPFSPDEIERDRALAQAAGRRPRWRLIHGEGRRRHRSRAA